MILILGLLWVGAAASGDRLVVVEATVPGGAVGDVRVRSAVGGMPDVEASALVQERLPPVTGTVLAEPLIDADRLLREGREAYLDGRFDEAVTQLAQARELLKRAVDSLDEERRAAETLFKAYMYLAFTLRARGGDSVPQATEVMNDALRTFPSIEPSVAEFGPENVKFYRLARSQLEQGPKARVRVHTTGGQATVYLNGRLVGVSPLDLKQVYVGRYLVHARQGDQPTRVHAIEIRPGDNEFSLDLSFDHVLQSERALRLSYGSIAARADQHVGHAAQLARSLDAAEVLVYWNAEERIHLTLVRADGAAREIECGISEVERTVADLRAGRVGQPVAGAREATRQQRRWTWVAGGVAAAALVGGVLLGMSAQSDFDSLNKKYPNGGPIDPQDVDLRDGGRSKQSAANLMFGVAGAAAITAGVLFFYEARAAGGGERAQVAPMIGPGLAGAAWQVRF